MFGLCYYLFFDSAISMENVPPSSPLAAPMINLVAVLLNWGSTYIRGVVYTGFFSESNGWPKQKDGTNINKTLQRWD